MQQEITDILIRLDGSNQEALDVLMPVVYEELHRLAQGQRRKFGKKDPLNTTALVHEAYLNLIDQRRVTWQNRAHFFGVAARVMRNVLLAEYRRNQAQKRGGGEQHIPLEEVTLAAPLPSMDMVALDDALVELEGLDERLVRIVEYRYFVGLKLEEISEVLGISVSTISREWRTARAWLHQALADLN